MERYFYSFCILQCDIFHYYISLLNIDREAAHVTYIHELHIGLGACSLIKNLNSHRNLYSFSFRDPNALEK